MPTTLIRTLKLTFTDVEYQAQLVNVAVVPTYSDTQIETFGDGVDPATGITTDTTESFALHVEGFQDWSDVTSLCDLLYATDITDTIPFEVTIAGATWAGNVKARKPNAGGAAGGALDFTIDLPVDGAPVYTPAGP